jgi:hypothetical protein
MRAKSFASLIDGFLSVCVVLVVGLSGKTSSHDVAVAATFSEVL